MKIAIESIIRKSEVIGWILILLLLYNAKKNGFILHQIVTLLHVDQIIWNLDT